MHRTEPESGTTAPRRTRRSLVRAARWLATGLLMAAISGMLPVYFEISRDAGRGVPIDLPRWAYLLLAVSVLQAAYSLYLAQLPDSSSIRVVTWFSLVVATLSAVLFGLTFLVRDDRLVIHWLELGERIADGRAAGWSFLMLVANGLISYCGGRLSGRF
jgi:hypothetical protein